MAIAFEAALAPAAQFVGSSGTITTGALNSSANADRVVLLLVVGQSSSSANAAISSVTYGGVSMTADTSHDVSLEYPSFSVARLFYLTSAPSGSNTFVITYVATTSIHIGCAAVAYSGAAGGVSAVTYPTNTSTSGTALTITQTTGATDTAVGLFAYPADQRAGPGTSVNERVDALADANTGTFYIADKSASTTSTTVDATAAGATLGWRAWGISLQPGGAAAFTPNKRKLLLGAG